MYLPLTDHLICPRCGPDHGMVLLADQLVDRRVLAGVLGCPSCQTRYPIVDGFVDLRIGDPPAAEGEAPIEAAADREAAIRMAALLGLTESTGYLLIAGPGVAHAPILATLGERVEVVATAAPLRGWVEEPGISRFATDLILPFHQFSMHGVALTGGVTPRLAADAARILSPAGRLVIEPAPPEAAGWLEDAGLEIMAREGETIVARQG